MAQHSFILGTIGRASIVRFTRRDSVKSVARRLAAPSGIVVGMAAAAVPATAVQVAARAPALGAHVGG
jgi:cysteine synthase